MLNRSGLLKESLTSLCFTFYRDKHFLSHSIYIVFRVTPRELKVVLLFLPPVTHAPQGVIHKLLLRQKSFDIFIFSKNNYNIPFI